MIPISACANQPPQKGWCNFVNRKLYGTTASRKSTVQAKSLYDLAERNRWQFIFEPGDGNQIVLLVIEKLRDSSLGVVRLRPTRASRKLGKPGFQSRGKAYGEH